MVSHPFTKTLLLAVLLVLFATTNASWGDQEGFPICHGNACESNEDCCAGTMCDLEVGVCWATLDNVASTSRALKAWKKNDKKKNGKKKKGPIMKKGSKKNGPHKKGSKKKKKMSNKKKM
jgi:hypothetical protein